MADLHSRLRDELNAARKAQDKPRTLLLGTIVSDVKNRGIELRRDPTDEEIVDVVRKGIKRRRESVEMYEKGGREELAAKEREEIGMLEGFLPAAVPEDQLRAAVIGAIEGGATTIGQVMGQVLPQFRGRAEGSQINALAREELAKRG